MKNNMYIFILLMIVSCQKNEIISDADKIKILANKYKFEVNNYELSSVKVKSIFELEQIMISINFQKKSIITSSTDLYSKTDTSFISKKIIEIKFLTNQSKPTLYEKTGIVKFEDPYYKYSKTLYFKNAGLIPNYAVNIQYNASNGRFTNVSISASPYGSYYFSGEFASFGQPQVYFYNGSLAFELRTSMRYSLNFPGVPYLGLNSTSFTQFNGYLQLDDNNNMSGSGFQSPFDPDALKYK